ncbi:MAG: pantetheine-phosphate adenylyltransferase [Armatimonadetes bacterium]|nr:pantetheine-phosphate adenylyltransferase [Armatimonadota bacterium]
MKRGVYPGSFDPLTNGHLDIIKRSSAILDELVVAIADNPNKIPLFSIKERLNILENTVSDIKNVKIVSFSGLLINFLKKINSKIIVKGLRALSDFENEFQMALLNRKLSNQIETIFLITTDHYAFLSSSAVKEIASFKGSVKGLVPKFVENKLKEKFKK